MSKIWENCRIQTLCLCHKDASHAWWVVVISRFVRILLLLQLPDCSRVPFLVLYGFYENVFLLHELDSTPRNDTRTEPRATGAGESSSRQQRDATHINQSPQEAARAGEYQIFLQLQDGSIPYCTLRPEIGLIRQEICRRTNIAVFNQRFTLAGRELHTGDNIRQTAPLSLDFNDEAGPGRMADSNFSMSWPACSKHPHWTRSTNELYAHTHRLVQTGISKFMYLLSSPSGVGSSKLKEITPQYILKANTADSSSHWKLKTAWTLSSSLCLRFQPTDRPVW